MTYRTYSWIEADIDLLKGLRIGSLNGSHEAIDLDIITDSHGFSFETAFALGEPPSIRKR